MKRLFLLIVFIFVVSSLFATEAKLIKDDNGWRLFVDGRPMAVHGIVWSFHPIGENYSFDLWSQPEPYIREMIDRDFTLMKKIGVNVVRTFWNIPPKWIEYAYKKYGIYFIVDYLFARYGITVDGIWYPSTVYADKKTRQQIKKEALETVRAFKDTPGVIMFIFGNENNYGLEWQKAQTGELPSGEQLVENAGYLYSLYEEVFSEAKKIDPHHPMGLVNGDLQYLEVIKALVPSLDVLGVNVYRGEKASDLFYQSVADLLDVPVVFTEIGADAYNIRTGKEDQYHQAWYILKQWEEIYWQSWGKGKTGNALGGFVFEWVDEWWKHGQEVKLDYHETVGTWNDTGFSYDVVPGHPNMNEEWFGIIAQSERKYKGISLRVPRAAYYVLGDIWSLNQYESLPDDVRAHFSSIDISRYLAMSEPDSIREDIANLGARVSGSFLNAMMISSYDPDEDYAEDGTLDFADVSGLARTMLRVDAKPVDEPDRKMELFATIRASYSSLKSNIVDTYEQVHYKHPAELYQAGFSYTDDYIFASAYYHTGHPDWALEGDYFYLLPEAYDLETFDRYNSKAPFGLEIAPRQGLLDGLVIYAGPELYLGARPQLIAKYYKDFYKLKFSLMHVEELSASSIWDNGVSSAQPSRRSSLWISYEEAPYAGIEGGLLFSGMEKLDESFIRVSKVPDGSGYNNTSYKVDSDKIGWDDTLGYRLRLWTDIFRWSRIFAEYSHMGAVADTHTEYARGGTFLPHAGQGNYDEYRAGFRFDYLPFSILIQGLYRNPIFAPVPDIGAGVAPRNMMSSPFYVWENREAIRAELVFSYDPQPETWIFDWNNKDREGAVFASAFSFVYNYYLGPTDAGVFMLADGTVTPFSTGLPGVYNTWEARLHTVFNPVPGFRLIIDADAGVGQSTGDSDVLVMFYGLDAAARWGRWIASVSCDINRWGPEDWYRTFNYTYPLQFSLDIAHGFDTPSFLSKANRIGLNIAGRSISEYSAPDDYATGANKLLVELMLYADVAF